MNRESRGVSPVIAVILMVAVTVILSAVIGAFVFDLGQSTTDAKQQSLGVSTTQTSGGVEITAVTGEASRLEIFVDGVEVANRTNVKPGDTIRVNASGTRKITVISVQSGDRRVVASKTVTIPTNFLTHGLIGHWKFDSGSGTTAIDSADSNDGTINGSTWEPSSQVGEYALSFDGSNDVVTLPSNSFDAATEEITVSAWVNADTSWGNGNERIVSSTSGNQRKFLLSDRNTEGNLWFAVFDSNDNIYSVLANNAPASGSWEHIVGVYNGSHLIIYINGQKDNSTSIGSITLQDSTDSGIGSAYVNAENFPGDIDDVRVYKRALPPQDVEGLYDETK